MAKRQPKSEPTWADVKLKLASFDRAGLLAVLQDLYAVAEGNRAFFHARFGLGVDPLEPYKKNIDRWLWPDLCRGQEPSVSRARKAITEYKMALNDPEGLAELMVFYCERAAGFCREVCHENTAYFDALVRMFEQALKQTSYLNGKVRSCLFTRLDRVRTIGRQLGYGVGDYMDVLLSQCTSSFQRGVLHGNR
jgi:hypothetical protein